MERQRRRLAAILAADVAGYSRLILRRYEDALEAGKHLAHRQKYWIHARMAATCAQLGRMTEAYAQAQYVPEFRISEETSSHRDPDDAAHVFEGMRKAGLPE